MRSMNSTSKSWKTAKSSRMTGYRAGAAWALSAVLARLSADKIGVTLSEGAVTPKYSLIFSIPWLTKKKKKPAAGPAAAGK